MLRRLVGPRTETAERLRGSLGAAVAVLALLLLAVPGTAGTTGVEGFLAVRGDRELASKNPDLRLPPASVVKLLVAMVALEALGPEHRIETRWAAHGELGEGVLAGSLVLHAAGDPTWGPELSPEDPLGPLRAPGEALRRRGIRRVEGDLVVDASLFPGRGVPPTRARGEAAYAVGAPTSPLAWDRGLVRIELGPGPRIGSSARLRAPAPGGGSGLDWENRVTTVGPRFHGRGTVDILPRWGTSSVLLEGEFPISEPVYPIEVAHPRPLVAAGEVVRRALTAAGVEVTGEVRVGEAPPTAPLVTARLLSPPLARRLEPILKDSSNWHSEMLVRSLAAEIDGEGRLDAGLEIVDTTLEELAGLEPEAIELDDGSGISPYSLVTPRGVVEALRWAATRPWFPVLVDLLPGPGEGTLVAWPRLPGLAGKTGTGRRTVALAGVVAGDSEAPILFCALSFASPLEASVQRHRIVARLGSLRAAAVRPADSVTE